MKYAVLEDKRQEHLKFCKYAGQLIERVSGKPSHSDIDASIDRIRRADVIAQTKIIYNEKELLQLIHDHLINKGRWQGWVKYDLNYENARLVLFDVSRTCRHYFSRLEIKLKSYFGSQKLQNSRTIWGTGTANHFFKLKAKKCKALGVILLRQR